MESVLITGATGFLGSNLSLKLQKSGYNVTAFVRKVSNLLTLEEFGGSYSYGDILNINDLLRAMKGIDYVFHTAGLVSFDNRLRNDLYKVNVLGTRNVAEAALHSGVKRLVHTSTVAALGLRYDGKLIDENTFYNASGLGIAYRDTKHLAEQEIMKMVERGLDAVIANPASIFGQRDIYFHSGVLLKFLKGRRFIPYLEGGMCVVGVDDVVEGEILMLHKGRKGERYILGGENLTFLELFLIIKEVLDGSGPIVNIKVPRTVAYGISKILEGLSTLTGIQPALTPGHVISSKIPHYYSSKKAESELGYTYRPIREAIEKAYAWYKSQNLI
ncbi:MAG: NAD-dependent epimerase/dehydratase family protein [Candidatus Kryptoniota bacterium]